MLDHLTTESRNPASEGIDGLSAVEIVRLMNAEDGRVAEAVGREAAAVAQAIEVVAERLRAGGRLVYVGAGTSGRLGVLDAAECPPTFNTPPEQVLGLIAGGSGAMFRSVEGAEDHPELAADDLKAVGLCDKDVLLGIATSGRTPYVIGGLEYARSQGAYTMALACNREASVVAHAQLAIVPVVGPEVLSGSTRLKAGTATKMVLNMISTGAMVLLGKTYGNLMVDLRATNSKLTDRARRIVAAITGMSESDAGQQLARCGGEVKTAIVAHARSVSAEEARRLLERSQGHLRRTLSDRLADPCGAGVSPGTVPVFAGTMRSIVARTGLSPSAEISPACAAGTAAPQTAELVLGIDGGGTKTVACLAPREGKRGQPPFVRSTLRAVPANGDCPLFPEIPQVHCECIGRGAAGPSNIQAVGPAEALANLDRAIAAAFADARVEPGPVAAAVLALAGSDREENRQLIGRWAEGRQLARRAVVVHDALPVLAAGTPQGWGVALIAGTGSLAFARDRAGRTARSGGWGYLFGDEGSAYAIAVAGLRAAAQAADGRGPTTLLLPAFQQRWNLPNALAMIPAVYPLAGDRAAIAALAAVVTAAAAAGDGVAQRILDEAAGQLAEMVAAVGRSLELPAAVPLALAGGLLTGDDAVQKRLVAELHRRGLQPEPVIAVTDPALGAVRLAQAEAESARLPQGRCG
jgi:N-acetylmuramic acid 6-phosphate etherase